MSWGSGETRRETHVAWSGGESQTEEHRDRSGALSTSVLEIDATYGRRLGLVDGATAAVEYMPQIEVCTSASVEPASFDDWEILELNAGVIEERLLQQARVVTVDQPFVFWLNASTSVCLVTTSLMPQARVALLDNDTEVVVAPKVRHQQIQRSAADKEEQKASQTACCCLRVAAGSKDVPYGIVYVNSGSDAAGLGAVVRVGHGLHSVGDDVGADWLAPWIVQIAPEENVQPGVLLASPAALADAGFRVGEIVRVGRATSAVEPATLGFESNSSEDSESIRRAIERALQGRTQIFVSIGAWLPDIDARLESFSMQKDAESETQIEYSQSRETPLRITLGGLESMDIVVENELTMQRPVSLDEQPDELAGVDEFMGSAWQSVESALLGKSSGLLVCGRRGSGKTSVARALAYAATTKQRNRLVHSVRIDCAALALEPRTNTVRDMLRKVVESAQNNSPSLLVLDDIDALLPAETENDHGGGRRVRMLVDLVDRVLGSADDRRVAVVATAAGRAQVHSQMFASGVIGDVLEIPAPGKAAREEILAALAKRSATPAKTSFALAAYRTEGFLPGDLHAAYERAAQEATMRVLEDGGNEEDIFVTNKDLTRALADFKPLAMRNIKTQASTTRWSDIGGLEDTRRQLRETLELPTKYAAVFASSPLRLRSGVLLYGFPGCGKTLLASAVARECGLNFIATKGPELLSKYIGSSEQAVRDLFARAVAAAPCVLFFDEFDAIAPRRGHDNTGVTDRVVNQFLTEMDGAEGLRGVYVLAATSRPDLIDPALLRPGRLDKAFLCPMPDTNDCAAILERHATKLRVDPSVDWSLIANRTDKFTGADLQALVYNAFLEAVHERVDQAKQQADGVDQDNDKRVAEFALLDETTKLTPVEHAQMAERLHRLVSEFKKSGSSSGSLAADQSDADSTVPVVTMDHFEVALGSTQSSLADHDRERFAAIYRDFVDDKKSDGSKKKHIEQRATMA
ncbi:Peroxisome biosynthesis protein pex1 [Coemansia sp. IMI 203386]|nr:Peroxisome biosynthesis protein pex1 [Coemansia sp. IMI 203386]